MIDFAMSRAVSPAQASQQAAASNTAQQGAEIRFVAGGTTLIDLMTHTERLPDGSLRIGAMVRNSDLAHEPNVVRDYLVLSEALLSGATGQLRNMASTGGNLLQRTRCMYFRDLTYTECNKRTPGSGCAALDGPNRIHAILGASQHCIATHPSDMAVAMMALEARVHILGTQGERDLPIGDFYLLPGNTPHLENVLKPGDLITYVTLPPPISGARSHYLKLRDRASYEFALASAAAIVQVESGRIRKARIAFGGIGTRPWRSPEAEHALEGKPAHEASFRAAADAALHDAKPQRDNAFKVELAKRCLIRALTTVTA
jgi:xanthine dehydrogenase YagS FAD-binding subunit